MGSRGHGGSRPHLESDEKMNEVTIAFPESEARRMLSELEALQARVMELEDWKSQSAQIAKDRQGFIDYQTSTIKGLREVIPNPSYLRKIADILENGGVFIADSNKLESMADCIERVMKGLQPIRVSNESLISREANDKIGSEFLANLSANPK